MHILGGDRYAEDRKKESYIRLNKQISAKLCGGPRQNPEKLS